MDYQDAPEIQLTPAQMKANEREITKLVKESDRWVKQEIEILRKLGYSDEEIDDLFSQ
jgi:hypothetical protein